eukprot:1366562-Amorphochlora_amoeboformis.AAC.1
MQWRMPGCNVTAHIPDGNVTAHVPACNVTAHVPACNVTAHMTARNVTVHTRFQGIPLLRSTGVNDHRTNAQRNRGPPVLDILL